MKNKNKLLAVLLVLALLLASCSGGGATADGEAGDAPAGDVDAAREPAGDAAPAGEGGDLTFALIPKTMNNPFFVGMTDAASATAAGLGVTLEVVAPPQESDIDQQINMFESMLERGVDGILIVPNGTREIVSSLDRAAEMGIPVITVDTDSEGGEKLCFIGTDNYGGGEMAGRWIGDTVQSGKVAFLTGTPGNLTHKDRLRGCREILEAQYPDMEIIGDALPTYSDRAQGMSQAENVLTAHPDIAVFYCVNDEIALGVSEAVQAAGKMDQVTIIGFDGSPEASQAILDGKITATLAQQPGKMGSLGVEAMYEYIINGTLPEAFTSTDCNVVTAENAADYLEWH